MKKDLVVPGNMNDIEKYMISRIDRIDARIEEYFKLQEEKITKLRLRFAAATVVIALATTIITDNIKTTFKQPALPAQSREAQSKR